MFSRKDRSLLALLISSLLFISCVKRNSAESGQYQANDQAPANGCVATTPRLSPIMPIAEALAIKPELNAPENSPLDQTDVAAIKFWSQIGYQGIRLVEGYSDAEIKSAYGSSLDDTSIAGYRERAAAFDKALGKLPKHEGFVYRGMTASAETLACWEANMLNGEVIRLGSGGRPGPSSATLSQEVAKRFASATQGFNVTVTMRVKSAVPISDYSEKPQEGEVIIPTSAKFKVLEVKRNKRRPLAVEVTLDQI